MHGALFLSVDVTRISAAIVGRVCGRNFTGGSFTRQSDFAAPDFAVWRNLVNPNKPELRIDPIGL